MKKFLTVLAIALIAMTAVFAVAAESANSVNGDKSKDALNLSLNIGGYTKFGFTDYEVKVANDSITPMGDVDVEVSGRNISVYASVITTHNDSVSITLELPKAMKANGVNDTISLTYTGKNFSTTEDGDNYKFTDTISAGRTKQAYSKGFTIEVEDYSQKVAGDYTAQLVMTVTAN
ncbi:MAG: hypothetical protein PUH25_10425 [Spirochaetales bacterium]|uniref:hypothetical protein n=1 Tax=Bullifex sp. TaxID=2815808 RepID=UPI002A57EA81|nr:hypothetical protein [Bullifex sp.]MDD7272277.1 hypothetical protein [Spirochaetales bacterium]MDY4067359.1 hypothetical protein [Bullifex sp.]